MMMILAYVDVTLGGKEIYRPVGQPSTGEAGLQKCPLP